MHQYNFLIVSDMHVGTSEDANNSIKEIKDDVRAKMLKNNNGKYKNVEFGNFAGIKVGMSLNEIVNTCLK